MARVSADGQGNRVRRYRRFLDITQADLAKRVEVSRQTIVSIEAGDYSPSVYLALRVARELERTVEELFGPEPDDQDKAAPVSGQGSMKVEGR